MTTRNFFKQVIVSIVVVKIVFAGINILYKLVTNDSMHLPIIVDCRFTFAVVMMVPVALLLDRNITWKCNITRIGRALIRNIDRICDRKSAAKELVRKW